MELVLVRHAATADEASGRCCGRLDVALSADGQAACKRLAVRLSAEPVSAVVSSPLRRARETADAIAMAHGHGVSILEGLIELDFGELEGRTFAEIQAAWPHLYGQWMLAPTTVRFPGGECYDDLHGRVVEAVETLRMDHDGHVVVAVTHAGVIRAVLAHALELPSDSVFRLAVDTGSMTRIAWSGGTPQVLGVNIRP
jgi:ribonuclease H / adenosylcobalamin/alpha-ribazole phosphatase